MTMMNFFNQPFFNMNYKILLAFFLLISVSLVAYDEHGAFSYTIENDTNSFLNKAESSTDTELKNQSKM